MSATSAQDPFEKLSLLFVQLARLGGSELAAYESFEAADVLNKNNKARHLDLVKLIPEGGLKTRLLRDAANSMTFNALNDSFYKKLDKKRDEAAAKRKRPAKEKTESDDSDRQGGEEADQTDSAPKRQATGDPTRNAPIGKRPAANEPKDGQGQKRKEVESGVNDLGSSEDEAEATNSRMGTVYNFLKL